MTGRMEPTRAEVLAPEFPAPAPSGYSLATVDEVLWRYTPRGQMRHAIEYSLARSSVCGLVNRWSDEDWYGTGSQEEYERVEQLPACPRCLAKVGAA